MTVAIILIVLLNLRFAFLYDLNCKFSTINIFTNMANVYACDGAMTNYNNTEEPFIHGDHEPGFGNDDVKGLKVTNQNLVQPLKNIDKVFLNLEQINFSSNKIESLVSSDLVVHKNLEHFVIDSNQITKLYRNIFNNLTNLKSFSMKNNKLESVQHDIELPLSISYYFESNTCISESATNVDTIKNLQIKFHKECPPTASQIEDSLSNRNNLLTSLSETNANLKNRLRTLEKKQQQSLEVLKIVDIMK